MMAGIIGTGLNADQILKAQQAKTDQLMNPGGFFQQIGDAFSGRADAKKQEAIRSLEAEEAQKLKMQQSDDARALGTQFALQGGDRNIPGLGYAVAEQLQASPDIRAQGVQNILGDPRINKVAAQELAKQEQAEMDANRYGSGWDADRYYDNQQAHVTNQKGIDNATFISDTIGTFTPADMAASPELKGEVQTALFGMLPVLQGIMESKQSTLREGERAMLEEFQGDPAAFFSSLLTRDAATIAKFDAIKGLLQREMDVRMLGLDETTTSRLNAAAEAARNPAAYRFQDPTNVAKFRAPSTRADTLELPGGQVIEMGADHPGQSVIAPPDRVSNARSFLPGGG